MKILYFILLSCFLSTTSCSTEGDENKPGGETPGNPNNPGTPENPGDNIDFSKVGVEYNDGKNIVFHVKIAIDKEGYELRPKDWFILKLKEQWAEINERFNKGDKPGGLDLNRNYIFVPDLEDIIIYEGKSNSSGGEALRAGKINTDKFQVIVSYDFVYQSSKNEVGGGCGTENGVSLITVIQANATNDGHFFDHFEKGNTPAAITHEFAHFRGVIDIYNHPVSASQNKVNGMIFKPIEGIMNGKTYGTIEQCSWHDYEIKVINKTTEKKIKDIITRTMRDYFPKTLVLKVTEKGVPVDGMTVNFYPRTGKEDVLPASKKEYTLDNGNTYTGDAIKLFFAFQNEWQHHPVILVEVISKSTKKKAYTWLADYELHDAGLDGKTIYEQTIDITD